MVFDGRFKLMHAEGGFRPMLFDLEADPNEFVDLAKGTDTPPRSTASTDISPDGAGVWHNA
ncbi:MAG: hypothetical protein R3C97_08950 [Geminicoccaceae bacterium]